MIRSAALIVNPASGRGRAGALAGDVHRLMRDAGVSVELLASTAPAHATELAAEAARRHETVVALGGDGMVSFVANGLIGTEAALGIVPAGSGNDFAVHLGYPRHRPLDAVPVLLHAGRADVDVGRVAGGPAFVCVASAGFDSEVNRRANRIRWARGTAVYVAAVFAELARFRPSRFRIEIDGEVIEREAMFVAAGNASSYGGGMRIAPGAVLDDGAFDIVIVGALGRAGLVGQFPRLFRGTHVHHPAVEVRRGSRVRIEAEDSFALFADGEEIAPLPADLVVAPGALRVCIPSEQD